jgi:hypothetical protein
MQLGRGLRKQAVQTRQQTLSPSLAVKLSYGGHHRTMTSQRRGICLLTSTWHHSDISCYGRSWPTADHDRSVLSSSSTPHISWGASPQLGIACLSSTESYKTTLLIQSGGVKSGHLSSAKRSPLCQASIDITIAKEPPELIKRFVSSSGRDRASYFSLRLLLRAHVRNDALGQCQRQARRKWCKVTSGGQLRRTGTTLEPAPTEV